MNHACRMLLSIAMLLALCGQAVALNYTALAAELAAGHPTTGAYNADNALAAAELNAVNRPNSNSVGAMMAYLLNKKHRTNQGADTTYVPIIGRLGMVAESAVGSDPFGRGAGNELNLAQITACKTFLLLFTSPHLTATDLDDANLPYGYTEASGAWAASHTAALQALSQNQLSRAQEIAAALQYSGPITATHVQNARAQ